MRHNIIPTLAAAAALSCLFSCEKESNFLMGYDEGQLNCNALTVDYINSGRQVRANAGVDVNDFTVNFVKTATDDTVKSFKYADMPEIVALPKGHYRAEASYGTDPIADWDSPYYLGSSEFDIEPGKITDNIEPVECALSNICVRVNIDDLGLGLLSDDAQVKVIAGKEGSLIFNRNTGDKAGYFKQDGSKTIIATFSGTVDGKYIENISKSYENAVPGNSYTINFTVNKPDNTEPGDVVIGGEGFNLDATITIKDENHVIDPNEPDDDVVIDDMRPVEDTKDPDNPDDPGKEDPKPDDPTPDDPTPPASKGPQIIAISDGLVIDQFCSVSECKFKVESETGITGFDIEIISEALTPEELDGIGLTDKFDLIHPGQYAEALKGFGFPVGTEVENNTSVEFDITPFLNLLAVFGPMQHQFSITVSDASGTTKGFVGLQF